MKEVLFKVMVGVDEFEVQNCVNRPFDYCIKTGNEFCTRFISELERGESSLIKESTGIYLRDVYDHTIQVIDTVETFRDMISGRRSGYRIGGG